MKRYTNLWCKQNNTACAYVGRATLTPCCCCYSLCLNAVQWGNGSGLQTACCISFSKRGGSQSNRPVSSTNKKVTNQPLLRINFSHNFLFLAQMKIRKSHPITPDRKHGSQPFFCFFCFLNHATFLFEKAIHHPRLCKPNIQREAAAELKKVRCENSL